MKKLDEDTFLKNKDKDVVGEKLFFQSSSKDFKKVGKELDTFKASLEFLITFKENRRFELHIGRAIIIFNGRETKKITQSFFNHKDFTEAIKKKFVIREVVNE